MAKQYVTTIVNGDNVEVLCDPTQTLLDVLRDEMDMTGTKEGCGTGDCGACSVTLDGVLVDYQAFVRDPAASGGLSRTDHLIVTLCD